MMSSQIQMDGILFFYALNNYTIVHMCAPNTHKLRFLRKLHNINTVQKGCLLWCRDFNLVPEPQLNSSASTRRGKPNLGPHLTKLHDIWRCQHAEEQDYFFFPSMSQVVLPNRSLPNRPMALTKSFILRDSSYHLVRPLASLHNY